MRPFRALACVACVGVATACSGPPQATFTVSGTYAIYGDIGAHFAVSGKRCVGVHDAVGIGDGTSVTVTDTDDFALATGALHGGTFTQGTAKGGACRFQLEVADVADGHGYYRLVITGRRVEQLSGVEAHKWLSLTWYAQ